MHAQIIASAAEWASLTRPDAALQGLMRRHIDLPGHSWRLLHFPAEQGQPIGTFDSSFDPFDDGSLILVPTPGHTPGSVSRLVRRDGLPPLLMVGDINPMRAAEEIRYLILAGQREGNRQLMLALKPLDITPAQGEVLRLLAEREPLTLTGLGELLICESGTNPSRLVDRLVRAGLVPRDTDTGDRRSIVLTLTPKGHETAKAAAKVEKEMHDFIDSRSAGHDPEALIFRRRSSTASPQ